MEEGTAELYLRAAQVEGNISLKGVGEAVYAGDPTLKGTLKVEKANLEHLNITEARVEGNVELSEVGLERGIYAERLVLGGDLRLMEVRLRYSLEFRGAQVGGKFEAKNIEGEGIQASGMQIGKSLIWEEIEAERVDLTGTRVGEELAIASLTGYKWESDEMIVVGKVSIKDVRILGGFGGSFLGNEVR
jgi:hypothetical protein